MRSQGVTLNNYSATNYNKARKSKQPSFKCLLLEDIGASDPRGSLKKRVLKNDGTFLFEYSTFVNDEVTGFNGSEGFVKKIAQSADIGGCLEKDIKEAKRQLIEDNISQDEVERITSKLSELESNLKIWKNLSKNEQKLKKFVLLLPGTIQGRTALFMANLKDKQGKQLEKVNLENVVDEIQKQDKIKLARGFKTENDLIPVKDLAGTGLGVGKKLANHPIYGQRLTKGCYAVVVQTGGGFGAVEIKFKKDKFIDIETSECSHDLFYDRMTNRQERLGKMGSSTSSVISNYAKEFGIIDPAEISALEKTGVAQIATQGQIRLKTKGDENAIKALLKTGAYEITSENFKNTTLQVKDIEKFNKASKYAIECYANSLCTHAITTVNKGANMYVLSGPLAMGLDDRVKEASELFKANSLGELISNMLKQVVSERKDNTMKSLMEHNGFEVICDRAVSVANNTEGGSLLLFAKNSLTRRGEWIGINKDVWVKPKSVKEFISDLIEMAPKVAKKVIKTLRKARA